MYTDTHTLMYTYTYKYGGFPGRSDNKESACNAGDPGSIPGSGRSPGEGNGYPLQHSCLRNSMDRGPWQEFMGSQRVRHDQMNFITTTINIQIYACEFDTYIDNKDTNL